jgi:hypothetical protein
MISNVQESGQGAGSSDPNEGDGQLHSRVSIGSRKLEADGNRYQKERCGSVDKTALVHNQVRSDGCSVVSRDYSTINYYLRLGEDVAEVERNTDTVCFMMRD